MRLRVQQIDSALPAWVGVCALFLGGCVVGVSGRGDQGDVPSFGDRETRGVVAHDAIDEASGLVASRKNPGVLWTHNDSGDGARLYAMNIMGEHLGTYTLEGITARDWEDLTLGPGPETGTDYLYVGDIGDNTAVIEKKYIQRIPEPTVSPTQSPVEVTLSGTETITFTYPDEYRDAETLMVDPNTRDIYVISKGASTVQVYRAPFPQSVEAPMVLDKRAPISLGRIVGFPKNLQGAVGGDIQPSGAAALVKTYKQVYYWGRSDQGDPFFEGDPAVLPYKSEPQGEAIAWAADGGGYFTLSEERENEAAKLYFYPRKPARASLSTTPAGVEATPPTLDSLHTALRLSLTSDKPQQVRIALKDPLDREAYVVWEGRMDDAKPVHVEVDARPIKTGTYRLRVETSEGWMEHPLQVDHHR